MIGAIVAIVVIGVVTAPLIPLTAIGLAACGLFPPVTISVRGQKMVFTAPPKSVSLSLHAKSDGVIFNYGRNQPNIHPRSDASVHTFSGSGRRVIKSDVRIVSAVA